MKKTMVICVVFLLVINSYKSEGNDGFTALFNGKTLEGWKQLNGKAKYEVIDGEIVGTTVSGTENSFLTTEKNYSDFVLELELLVDEGMNSGIQFRSESTPEYNNGRVHGYQCEVDPSSRAWSGGIYDEARRGWLYPGTFNPDGGQAFKQNEWNKYRIECIGNSIRTWLNGAPVSWLIDDMTPEGFICLQVHSVKDESHVGKQIRWRNIRIKTGNLKPSPVDDIFVVNLIPNNLSYAEKKQGWKFLFDGKTTHGWRGANLTHFPDKGWEIKEGILSVLASDGAESQNGGDIITKKQYGAFELQWSFMLTEGANSGVKYFVDLGYDSKASAIGLEFQLQDDALSDDPKENHVLASLYDLIPAQLDRVRSARQLRPVGKWNTARIVVFPDNHVEHWLNGIKVLEYTRGDENFKTLVSNSKYAQWKGFGLVKKGHILLQDHGGKVSFRDIKIRTL